MELQRRSWPYILSSGYIPAQRRKRLLNWKKVKWVLWAQAGARIKPAAKSGPWLGSDLSLQRVIQSQVIQAALQQGLSELEVMMERKRLGDFQRSLPVCDHVSSLWLFDTMGNKQWVFIVLLLSESGTVGMEEMQNGCGNASLHPSHFLHRVLKECFSSIYSVKCNWSVSSVLHWRDPWVTPWMQVMLRIAKQLRMSELLGSCWGCQRRCGFCSAWSRRRGLGCKHSCLLCW